MAATKFAMDVEQTQSNLSSADKAGAAQSSSKISGVRVGGYMTSLATAVIGVRTTRQAAATTRSTTNATTRQFSIATVQTAEASNASVLTT